jgi:hypothetical protein
MYASQLWGANEVNVLGHFGMRGPCELKKLLHALRIALAKILSKNVLDSQTSSRMTFSKPILTKRTTSQCGNPAMQSIPGCAAGPEPLAAQTRLFTVREIERMQSTIRRPSNDRGCEPTGSKGDPVAP